MSKEKLPIGAMGLVAAGAVFLVVLAIGEPGKPAEYAHKKPAVDVNKIGVESLIPKTGEGAGLEGTLAHAETHKKVEASIFFTPGGQYTAQDIARNGTQAPSVKFGDISSVHDMNPEKGTLVCPITKTKANPLFYWWVGGKKYTFCCPPCIEEFVLKAKKSKVPLPPPQSFVQK